MIVKKKGAKLLATEKLRQKVFGARWYNILIVFFFYNFEKLLYYTHKTEKPITINHIIKAVISRIAKKKNMNLGCVSPLGFSCLLLSLSHSTRVRKKAK